MALAHAGVGDADEFRPRAHLLDGGATDVTHRRAHAASDLAAVHPFWSILDKGLPAEEHVDIRSELGVQGVDAQSADSPAAQLANTVRYVHQGDWEGITVVTCSRGTQLSTLATMRSQSLSM